MTNDEQKVNVAYHELATIIDAFNKDNSIIFGKSKTNGNGLSQEEFQQEILRMKGKDFEEIKTFILDCKPYMDEIKAINGSFDSEFIKMGSIVYNSAMSHILYSYDKQKTLYLYQKKQHNNSNNLQKMYNELMELLNVIQELPMDEECRSHYDRNRAGIITQQEKHLSNDGCYIATMVYGDYNHPQVITLRKYRDDVLRKSSFGKWFIDFYYRESPGLVNRLKNCDRINNIIRIVLDRIVNHINNKFQ